MTADSQLPSAPRQCPVCSSELYVARLQCSSCATALEGRFSLGRFGRLSKEQLSFVEAFLACRGKIKDVEQLLGVSYPTVVARLDDAITTMGFDAPTTASSPAQTAARKEILDKVAQGKLTASEAAAQIRALKKNGGQ